MRNLLIAIAVVSVLAGCDTDHITDDSCRENIDYSNQFVGQWACSFAVLGAGLGHDWW